MVDIKTFIADVTLSASYGVRAYNAQLHKRLSESPRIINPAELPVRPHGVLEFMVCGEDECIVVANEGVPECTD